MVMYGRNKVMNMREVTKEVFYGEIFFKNLDVHPRPEKHVIIWEHRKTRKLFGRETPGYLGKGEKAYFLAEEQAA